MIVTAEKTVGEIASQAPAAARVFEKYGIDYCCAGKVLLEQACRERGIAPEELFAELENAAGGSPGEEKDWTSASLSDLIQHILEIHHAYLKEQLPRLAQIIEKVVAAHGEKHGESLLPLQTVFRELKDELESHMWKEEIVLFPLIRNLEEAGSAGGPLPPAHCGSINNPIRVMEHEHEAAGRALSGMRSLTRNYTLPEDACNTYRVLYYELPQLEADLHRHIHLENNILFPRAARLEASLL